MKCWVVLGLVGTLAVPSSVRSQEAPDILRALDLPKAAAELRVVGVSAEEVRVVIESARRRSVPAGETETVMVETVRAVREHGPVENFGAFLQTQLDGGLRGRDLAAAIRAEHARRGIGKGKRLDPAGKAGKGRGGRLDSPSGKVPGQRDGMPETGGEVGPAGRGRRPAVTPPDSVARPDSAARPSPGRRRMPPDTTPGAERPE